MGHGTLPKLNHADPSLRSAMVEGPDSVVARWLRPPFDVDGWRIDVANMTGRLGAVDVNHEVARRCVVRRRRSGPTRSSSASTTTTRRATSTATAGTGR